MRGQAFCISSELGSQLCVAGFSVARSCSNAVFIVVRYGIREFGRLGRLPV